MYGICDEYRHCFPVQRLWKICISATPDTVYVCRWDHGSPSVSQLTIITDEQRWRCETCTLCIILRESLYLNDVMLIFLQVELPILVIRLEIIVPRSSAFNGVSVIVAACVLCDACLKYQCIRLTQAHSPAVSRATNSRFCPVHLESCGRFFTVVLHSSDASKAVGLAYRRVCVIAGAQSSWIHIGSRYITLRGILFSAVVEAWAC